MKSNDANQPKQPTSQKPKRWMIETFFSATIGVTEPGGGATRS